MAIIYALIDISKPGIFKTPYFTLLYEPYYIGKGYEEKRPMSHYFEAITRKKSRGKRSYKQNKIIKLNENGIPYEYVMFECVDEDDAFIKETELIRLFGKFSEGGMLTNVNDGGVNGTKKGYVHCHDQEGNTVYVKNTDDRIKSGILTIVGFGSKNVMCIDDDGNVYKVPCDEYDPSIHKHMHKGVERPEYVRNKISESKKKYTFTDEHLHNITEANRLISQTVHLGAKRKQSTKKAISKSRYGSKSKVANIWKLTSPDGDVIIYKGGLVLAENLFNINGNRLTRYEGGVVPFPNYTGHKNERIYNTTGWKLEKNPDHCEINFEFIFS